MLFPHALHEGLRSGAITLTVRRWTRPQAKITAECTNLVPERGTWDQVGGGGAAKRASSWAASAWGVSAGSWQAKSRQT